MPFLAADEEGNLAKKGSLAKWLKKEGETVKAGDVIAEIETDKAIMEVESLYEGTLGQILVPEGTCDVPVNAPLVSVLLDGETFGSDSDKLELASQLLGGDQVLQRGLKNTLDVHELLLSGLPWGALDHLSRHLVFLGKDGLLEPAIGISPRTFQRHKVAPDKRLSSEQSGRVWKFVEILARATAIFGSQRDAENWLQRNAIGLEQRRPIDLLQTPAGVKLVEEHLTRMEYGVYA